jgi:hypothetical protein
VKRTVIDPVPVRYSYAQPSLSRRGGVRLHPIKDGTAPIGQSLAGLRLRDKAGNKLRDVVNPLTGYVMYVESALESPPRNQIGQPVQPGISGTHTQYTRDLCLENREGFWTDDEGNVVRTFSMGDEPLPRARVCPTPKTVKERRVPKHNGRTAPSVAGGSGTDGRITKSDCVALIRVMAKGRQIEITPAMIRDARKMLVDLQKKAAQAAQKKG